MEKYRFVLDVDKETYDGFVRNHPYCNLLQSYDWAKVKTAWRSLHTGVVNEEGKLCAAGLVLIRSLPLHQTMFYLPRGPIMDYTDEELVCFYFDHLKTVAKAQKAVMIKFDPAIVVNSFVSTEANENRCPDTQRYLDIFTRAGAKHSGFTKYIEETAQARYVSVVKACEDLDAAMPKHTKRLIKDADRYHVEVVHGGTEYLDSFARLVSMTEERKKVDLRDEEYFRLLMDTYGEDAVIFLAVCNVHRLHADALKKKAELEKEIAEVPENSMKKLRRLNDQLTAVEKDIRESEPVLKEVGDEDKDTAIAGILSIRYGKQCEMLYAGMDQRFKKFMPQYKTYVENFRWAFERGCTYADMGGVEGTFSDGLTKFKDNFNPVIEEFIGEFDIPVNHLLYGPVSAAYRAKKKQVLKEVEESAAEREARHQ